MWIIFRNPDLWLGENSWVSDIDRARRVSDIEAMTILLLCSDTSAFFIDAGLPLPPAGASASPPKKLYEDALSAAA